MTSTTYSAVQAVVGLAERLYGNSGAIPLHKPVLGRTEKEYISQAIDSQFVSSVGAFVDQFENRIAAFTGAKRAVATVNGTAALHAALYAIGVTTESEVITQPLTFVATCNAIRYCGAYPTFVDIEPESLGLSPDALRSFLRSTVVERNGVATNGRTGRRIAACVPMHTFGLALQIGDICSVCAEYGIPVVEDAAESLGTLVGAKHTGTFGTAGVFSFNGNKIITTGGGGAIVTDDPELAKRVKHLTTTAKRSHPWEYYHDELGFNYRMPNINAALGCAQMDRLQDLLKVKRTVHLEYEQILSELAAKAKRFFLFRERPQTTSNYWLNAVALESQAERNEFLGMTHDKGVMTRPAWTLLASLPEFHDCERDSLAFSTDLGSRVVCLPSSAPEMP